MKKIIKPGPINLSNFSGDLDNLEAKFGLPSRVMFCRDCVVSNQRPSTVNEYEHTKESKKKTIKFNENRQCSACQFAEKKNNVIDWQKREQKLLELCNKYRRKDGKYDCVVPGSGGKDSVYAAHILKTKYGMHPLTVTWAPHIYTEWGWKNFQSWIKSGFDNYLLTPNARVHRLLTRLAVENMFFPFQPFVFGQKSFAPKMALLFNIPLVFYGESGAEYGSPIEYGLTPHRDRSTYTAKDLASIFLGGVSIAELRENYGLDTQDLISYLPANPDELFEKKVEVHRLGYYLQWHPQKCYYYAVEHCGFQASPERTPGTYSKYNSIDDKMDDFYYYTAFIKFGIGRATSDAAQEIRSGDITREEGVALVKKYDAEFPERFANEFLEYLSINPEEYPVASKMFEEPIMDKKYFVRLTDYFRSPHLWKYENGKWELRHTVWSDENNRRVDPEMEASKWTGNVYQV
jgi:N-acetyl sugar amidotransferase